MTGVNKFFRAPTEGERGESMTGCGMRPKYTEAQQASRTWGKGHFTPLGPVAPKLRASTEYSVFFILFFIFYFFCRTVGCDWLRSYVVPGTMELWTGLRSNYGAIPP